MYHTTSDEVVTLVAHRIAIDRYIRVTVYVILERIRMEHDANTK